MGRPKKIIDPRLKGWTYVKKLYENEVWRKGKKRCFYNPETKKITLMKKPTY